MSTHHQCAGPRAYAVPSRSQVSSPLLSSEERRHGRPQDSHPAGTAQGTQSPEPPRPPALSAISCRGAFKRDEGSGGLHNGSHLGRKHSSPGANGRRALGRGLQHPARDRQTVLPPATPSARAQGLLVSNSRPKPRDSPVGRHSA